MRAAGIVVAAGIAGLSSAAPTSADATVTTSYYGVQAQFDNSPGSGAASWVWVYGGSGGGSVQYEGYDGVSHTLNVDAGQSASTEPNFDVWRIRACANGLGCGSWT